MNFTKWLKFRSTFGIDYANTLDYRFAPIFDDNGAIAGSSASVATITNNRSSSVVQLYTQQLTFDKEFGSHHVNAIAVYETQTQQTKNENASGQQESNELRTLNNAKNVSVQTLVGENTLLSYLGRLNYDYKGKYILSAAIRRDGLSVWAPGKKWATFPSGSVGWRIDQENFMLDQSTISELKVRAGYGLTGLNGTVLGNTPWLVSVNANSAQYPFNNNITGGPSSSIQRLGNQELEWETTKQLNLGLDLGLLQNKFTLSLEYYNRKTDNLILSVPLAPSMGYITSTVSQNVGSMKNSGFEAQLGYNDRQGAFTWFGSANLSFVTNQVVRLTLILAHIILQTPRLTRLFNPFTAGRYRAFSKTSRKWTTAPPKLPVLPQAISSLRTMTRTVLLTSMTASFWAALFLRLLMRLTWVPITRTSTFQHFFRAFPETKFLMPPGLLLKGWYGFLIQEPRC